MITPKVVTREDFSWGTSLQGYINISYSDMVELFGEPTDGDGYKVDVEWVMYFDDSPVTIYNYKDGPNYNGDQVFEYDDCYPNIEDKDRDWHIGGEGPEAVMFLSSYLDSTSIDFSARLG